MRRDFKTTLLLCLLSVLLAGCGSQSTPVSGVMSKNGFPAQPTPGTRIELRYLKESKGSNYKSTDVSADGEFIRKLMDGLAACKPAEKPEREGVYPELGSDCEILFSSGGVSVSFYVDFNNSLLVYRDWETGKDGDTVRYLYWSAGEDMISLLQGMQPNARLRQDTEIRPFRSFEELKASVDAEELSEEGTELDFEFFTEAVPPHEGTACRVLTHADLTAVPEDSVLIAAYGRTKTGEQQKLSILGMESNTNYTKIIVAEPDEALDSVDAGGSPESFAILVRISAIDKAKWIVFVDGDSTLWDVIVPDDIEEIRDYAAPAGSGGPDGPAASPGDSSAEDGPGD